MGPRGTTGLFMTGLLVMGDMPRHIRFEGTDGDNGSIVNELVGIGW